MLEIFYGRAKNTRAGEAAPVKSRRLPARTANADRATSSAPAASCRPSSSSVLSLPGQEVMLETTEAPSSDLRAAAPSTWRTLTSGASSCLCRATTIRPSSQSISTPGVWLAGYAWPRRTRVLGREPGGSSSPAGLGSKGN
jgi:hypothetical protein